MMARSRACLLAAAALVAVIAWWLTRPSRIPPEITEPAAVTAAQLTPQPAVTPASYTSDPVPIHPAGSADVNAVGMLPHPITPTHARIFRENNLIGELNGAMDVKDVAGLRALLEQYRNEYPEDAHVLQDGYALIADCLEHPAETRARARRYYDEELDSGLRRYIRRYCLE